MEVGLGTCEQKSVLASVGEASLVTDGTIRRVTVVHWGQTAQWEPVTSDYMTSRNYTFSRGLRDLHSLAIVRPRRTLQLPAKSARGK
jgi:hypothetical protein